MAKQKITIKMLHVEYEGDSDAIRELMRAVFDSFVSPPGIEQPPASEPTRIEDHTPQGVRKKSTRKREPQ